MQFLIKPKITFYILILFSYPFLALKAFLIQTPLEFNLLIFSLLTLFFIGILWWNFIQIQIAATTLTIQRGIFKKTKPKSIQLDELRDVLFKTEHGMPAGHDLITLSISLFIKEHHFSIYTKQGILTTIDKKAIGGKMLLDYLVTMIQNRTLLSHRSWLLKENTWYQLEKNGTEFNLLDENGSPILHWQNLILQNIAGNKMNLYKNGQIVLNNVEKSLSTLYLIENLK